MSSARRDGLKRSIIKNSRLAGTPATARMFVQPNAKTSSLAEMLGFVQMMRHDILAYKPFIDVGADIITQHHHVLKRVQVKGQATDSKESGFTFPTTRTDKTGRVMYKPGELDAFVFVHTVFERFFVVPAEVIIDAGRRTITFGPHSHQEWENAWWLLKMA